MANIRDVARASRVSVATVSRVFNEHPRVSVTTRRRVLATASRLQYWPNGIARSLITSRTHTLGLLMPELHGEFFSEVIHGVDLAARTHGLQLLLSRSSSGHDGLAGALRAMRGRVDGLMVMAPDFDAGPALAQAGAGIPIVLLGPLTTVTGCDSVAVDNRDGALQATRHLLAVGHRRVAIINGPPGNIDAWERRAGWRAALSEAGIAAARTLEAVGDFSERSGYEAMRHLLARDVRPDAVFAANDYMAAGALGAIEDAGLRVPHDLAVAGFDDIPLARYLSPPLTTVHVDLLTLGGRAIELLVERCAERAAARTRRDTGRDGATAPRRERHDRVPSTLVVRGSCGAPRERVEARSRLAGERPAGAQRR